MTAPSEGFDRLRRRGDLSASRQRASARRRADPQGHQALYSTLVEQPAPGAVTVECSSCGASTNVTPRRLLKLAFPSMHLPVLRRGHSSWMRCPACHRRTWVRLVITL
jgi:hypothetical protein